MMIQSLYCVVITLKRVRALARDLPKSALNYILTSILFFVFVFVFFPFYNFQVFSFGFQTIFVFVFTLFDVCSIIFL